MLSTTEGSVHIPRLEDSELEEPLPDITEVLHMDRNRIAASGQVLMELLRPEVSPPCFKVR